MLSFVVRFFGGFAEALFWFITSVVIPVTIWFTVLKINIADIKEAQAQASNRAQQLEIRVQGNEDLLADQLEKINRSLGNIEGELKRIK